jgi:hypothetical protein
MTTASQPYLIHEERGKHRLTLPSSGRGSPNPALKSVYSSSPTLISLLSKLSLSHPLEIVE